MSEASNEQMKKMFDDELNKYKKSQKPYKSYMEFMDDISAWLKGLGK